MRWVIMMPVPTRRVGKQVVRTIGGVKRAVLESWAVKICPSFTDGGPVGGPHRKFFNLSQQARITTVLANVGSAKADEIGWHRSRLCGGDLVISARRNNAGAERNGQTCWMFIRRKPGAVENCVS